MKSLFSGKGSTAILSARDSFCKWVEHPPACSRKGFVGEARMWVSLNSAGRSQGIVSSLPIFYPLGHKESIQWKTGPRREKGRGNQNAFLKKKMLNMVRNWGQVSHHHGPVLKNPIRAPQNMPSLFILSRIASLLN